MVHSRKENAKSTRKFIIFHHSSDKLIRNIAKLVNFSHSIVKCVIRHFQIENMVRKSLPRKFTKHGKGFTISKYVKNPSLNLIIVNIEFNEKFSPSISPETV